LIYYILCFMNIYDISHFVPQKNNARTIAITANATELMDPKQNSQSSLFL
jgi:hypothetical protein